MENFFSRLHPRSRCFCVRFVSRQSEETRPVASVKGVLVRQVFGARLPSTSGVAQLPDPRQSLLT